ncbi:MAG: type VI secretion system baseplate subunit TssG [Pyrinomonadaceae bacterium]
MSRTASSFSSGPLDDELKPRASTCWRCGGPVERSSEISYRVSLVFPPSQLYDLKRRTDDDDQRPPEMTVAFMGLTGPSGVLPLHYTELMIERARYKDTAMWEFFDIFNHRLISLFFRAWEKYRLTASYESGDLGRFTEYLFCLIGMGTRGLRGRLNLPDEGLIRYSGLISQKPHSAAAVSAIISDYFDVPAQVNQFAGQWFTLEAESQTRLGVANTALGVSTVAGERVWDTQSKFDINLGPLTLERFTAFLPTGSAHKPAVSLIRHLMGLEFDFDLRMTLKAREVPGCVLTTRAKRKPMLGWTTWLKTNAFAED